MLDENETQNGWMWGFATEEQLLYLYAPSRGGAVAHSVLGDSTGTLTVDAMIGYNLVTTKTRRKRGGCWSHARRGLYEAPSAAEAAVDGLLADIGALYDVEYEAIVDEIVGTSAHLALRQELPGCCWSGSSRRWSRCWRRSRTRVRALRRRSSTC